MGINDFCYLWSKFFKKLKSKSIKKCHIHHTAKIEAGSTVVDSLMERYSFCGYDCEIINCAVGSFCSIANQVIIGAGEHPLDWVGMSPVFYEGRDSIKAKFSEHQRRPHPRTIIGHDVWIGQRALIKAGVTIGNGAVIGMGSVVTKDVEPYSIVAGNPARCIRKRFDEETIAALLDLQWWLWPEDKLRREAQFFNNTNLFISRILHK